MATFVFELRCEEIPANALPGARKQLLKGFEKRLKTMGFSGFQMHALSTNRRLAVMVSGLPERQDDRREELQGPPKRIAFDADGNPTRAALGFASKVGLPIDEIQVVETAKGEYLSASLTHIGRETAAILAEVTPAVVGDLKFPKVMRWGTGEHSFVRPVHGVLALFDSEIVEIELFGHSAGRETLGHRVTSPDSIALERADQYEETLESHGVTVDPVKRRAAFDRQAEALATEVGCELKPDEKLIAEHVELVEHPGLIRGGVASDYLELPDEVLVTTLRHHQKCLVLTDAGSIAPYFLAVVDRPDDPEGLIQTGNEWVVGARLADAAFFFGVDRKQPLESQIENLERIDFHAKLGSLADKCRRVGALATTIGDGLDIGDVDPVAMALLAKADLATQMVNEFANLQGIMGGHYLRLEGAAEEQWTAARDHYQPVGFDGEIPSSQLGRLIAVADRIDTIAGLFACGEKPTGSRDPFALRRAAQSVVKILAESDWDLDLLSAIASALELQPIDADLTEEAGEIGDFFVDRVRRFLMSQREVSHDACAAALFVDWSRVPTVEARAQALEAVRSSEAIRSLAAAFKRVRNITAEAEAQDVDSGLFVEAVEGELDQARRAFAASLDRHLEGREFAAAFEEMQKLATVLDRFFVDVLVMADDEALRSNRIGLLATLRDDFLRLADLSLLEISE